MAIGLLGRKVGMTQIFGDGGDVIPVTVIQAGPCRVLQVKSLERDAYEAVQVGFLDKPRRLAARSERGHVAKLDSRRAKTRGTASAAPKADCEPARFVREFRVPTAGCEVGQVLDVTQFVQKGTDPKTKKEIDVDVYVDVIGTSKGRGTAGVMVRHNFHGQRATHGVKKVHRHAGSIGCSQFPGHVTRGRRMAGRHGNARRTARNLKVVRIDQENHLLLVRGGVPGPNGGLVMVQLTNVVR